MLHGGMICNAHVMPDMYGSWDHARISAIMVVNDRESRMMYHPWMLNKMVSKQTIRG